MRVIRSFILLLGVAVTAAGCAQPQVAYMAYPGIDNVVYGGARTISPYGANGSAQAAPVAGQAVYAASPYGANGYAQAAPVVGQTVYAASPYGANGYAQAAPVAGQTVYAASPYGANGYAQAAPVAGQMVYATSPYGANGYAQVAPVAAQSGYALDSGDRLRVVIFGQEGLTNSYIVDAGGFIDMPLIGSVPARGATTEQLANRISEKLREGFIREPHVAVEVEAYRPFFILGEVTQPGQYPYVANMTAETAIAIAGGFTPRAMRKTVVLNRTYYGQQMRIAVPLSFPLRPGDTINVQERWF